VAFGSSAALQPEPDTRVPVHRLREVLDPQRLRDALHRGWRHPGVGDLVDCRVDRVHPRGARGYVIVCELRFRDGEASRTERRLLELVAGDAKAHYRRAVESLRKRRRKQLKGVPDPADIACLPDLGAVMRRPGLDERLHGLQLLRSPKLVRAALPPISDGPSHRSAELLAHRLGKRCVVRFGGSDRATQGGAGVIAKMFPAGRGRAQAAHKTMCELWQAGLAEGNAVRIPRALAVVPDWDMVLMEDVSREPVCCLSGDDPGAGVQAAGRALRALHRCEVRVGRRHGVDEEQAILDSWVELVSAVYPHRRDVFRQARAWTVTELQRCREFEPAVVHRDFHEKQVALGARATVLMDFDTLCLSDPAIDIGNFIAHLQLAGLEERIASPESLAQAFLDGYAGAADPRFRARAIAHQRATLLRLACLNAFSEHRRQRVSSLLELL
jgi:hypothetical protein